MCAAVPAILPWERTYDSVQDCISAYFHHGLKYESILHYMRSYHGIHMTYRQLRYVINIKLGLRRFSRVPTIDHVISVIRHHLTTESAPSDLLGYRNMYTILKYKYSMNVTRDKVMEAMRMLDPDSSERRRRRRLTRRKYASRGPNWAWHIDGYDKLSRWGICISGAIDGFSRKIIFLKAGPTNHDPRVIAKYFVDSVTAIGGCPCVVQTDRGTENGIVCRLQNTFTNGISLNENLLGHRYSSSPHNQRIEAWWAQLRKMKVEFWINKFKELTEEGHFIFENNLHRWTLQFVFMPIIQRDLDEVAYLWNVHRIRNNTAADSFSGIPNEMYNLCETLGVRDHKINLDEPTLQWAYSKTSTPSTTGNDEFEQLLINVMENDGIERPMDWQSAFDLYFRLLGRIPT